MRKAVVILLGTALSAGAAWTGGPFMPANPWVISSGPARHAVALTFDDGPNPVYTREVLQVLRDYDARATFFVVGANVEKHPEVAREIARQGHELGNHSMTHRHALPFGLPHQIRRDYRQTQHVVWQATDLAPRLYRAPHGRMSPWMAWTLHREGARLIGWDVSPKDWEESPPEVIVRRVLDDVRPGSIILLHDGLDLDETAERRSTVHALPGLIEGLRDRGYLLMTVGELLGDDAGVEGYNLLSRRCNDTSLLLAEPHLGLAEEISRW